MGTVRRDNFRLPGNHEYDDPNGDARGYFDYWASKSRPTGGVGNGCYSFDLGPGTSFR